MLNEFEREVRSSFYVKLLADFIFIKYATRVIDCS